MTRTAVVLVAVAVGGCAGSAPRSEVRASPEATSTQEADAVPKTKRSEARDVVILRTQGGTRLTVVPTFRVGTVSLRILFKSQSTGTLCDASARVDRVAAEYVRLAMLSKADDSVRALGVDIKSVAADGYTGVAGTVLHEHVPQVVGVLASALRRPVDETVLSSARAEARNPLAGRDLVREAYLHSLLTATAPSCLSDQATQPDTTLQSVTERLNMWARTGPSWIVAAGRLSAQELAERVGHAWTGNADAGGESPAHAAPSEPSSSTAAVVLIDQPTAQQSYVAYGRVLPGGSASRGALEVVHYALGGTFGARVNHALRNKLEVSYYARTELRELADGRFSLVAIADVNSDRVGEALKTLSDEFDDMAARPPTGEELSRARSVAHARVSSYVESNNEVADFLMQRPALSTDNRAWGELVASTASATDADLEAAYRALAGAGDAIVVVSGPAAKLRPQIEELDFVVKSGIAVVVVGN